MPRKPYDAPVSVVRRKESGVHEALNLVGRLLILKREIGVYRALRSKYIKMVLRGG